MRSIAVLGGTFDPIHQAHLELAEILHNQLAFEKILLIPCKQNPLKNHVIANTEQRVEMIRLAMNEAALFSPDYEYDLREVKQDNASITIDTLKALRQNYPKGSLTFTMGVDAFNDLDQWDNFEALLDYAHLLIFPRPGFSLAPKPLVQRLIDQYQTDKIHHLHGKKQGHIYFSSIPEAPISSTVIRALLKKRDLSPLQLALPKAVLTYIQVEHLYGL